MRWFGFLLIGSAVAGQTQLVLDHAVHLRSGTGPEWEQFAGSTPRGSELRWNFQAAAAEEPWTLLVTQDDVKLDWPVQLNGRPLGNLFLMEAPLQQMLLVPRGTLREGSNELLIQPPRANDDIRVGPIRLCRGLWPLDQTTLEIKVTDIKSEQGLPCRITIADSQGALAALSPAPGQRLACRPGVVYTPDGSASVHLLPGGYTIYATRGFEYSLAKDMVTVSAGQTSRVSLELRREVDTGGYVSCDPHTHTFTYSRHGDATVEERVITLAGEGIELPVATDHNILTDYAPAARELGLDRHFTPVIGDEVTTQKAHYNVFPVAAGSRVPNFMLPEWEAVLQSIRQTPGVEVIILNHPHNVHHDFEPFAPEHFDKLLARPAGELGYHAIELLNSSALQTDLWQVFEDWFALLEAGHRLSGIGSSDVHDVSRYIVGQGRTYLRCPDDDPGNIDVGAACRALREGRALVSLGLLVDLKINGTAQPGDTLLAPPGPLAVEVSVKAPAWIEADRVELYRNGERIQLAELDATGAGGEKARLHWTLPPPTNDFFLVAIATGPPVRDVFWAIPRPYQPRGPVWHPRVMGCTNPIWIKTKKS